MKKKIVSLICVCSILISFLLPVNVSAKDVKVEESIPGWRLLRVYEPDDYTQEEYKALTSYEISQEEVKSGEKSLKVTYQKDRMREDFISVSSTVSELRAGEYTLSFWVKNMGMTDENGNPDDEGLRINVAGTNIWKQFYNDSWSDGKWEALRNTPYESENGWDHYKLKFIIDESNAENGGWPMGKLQMFQFEIHKRSVLYFDDVVLTYGEEENNLLENAGFEEESDNPPEGETGVFLKKTYEDGQKYPGEQLPYRLYLPKGYDETKKYPMLLFLHGAGERGSDNEVHIKNNTPFDLLLTPENQEKYPCIIVAPQCPHNRQWVDTPWENGAYNQDLLNMTTPLSMAYDLVGMLEEAYAVDTSRQYIMGISMGGFGTWDMITRFPDKFAAAVPICGGGDPSKAKKVKNLPIWTTHGDADDIVPVSGTRAMAEALKALGADVRYTEYSGAGHGDCWVKTYQEPELLPWLFSQVKQGQNPDITEDASCYPSGVMAVSANGKNIVSWRNPTSAILNMVSLYEVAGEEEKLIAADINQSGGVLNSTVLSAEPDIRKYYKIKSTFRDGTATEVFCSGTASEVTSFHVADGWNTTVSNGRGGTPGYCSVNARLDSQEKVSGNTSLKIVSNIDAPADDLYLGMVQSVNTESRKKYRLTLWAKSQNAQDGTQVFLYNDAKADDGEELWGFYSKIPTAPAGQQSDWTQYTYHLSNKSAGDLKIMTRDQGQAVWLDDIELYEIDDNGNTVGENLIVNGGFETDDVIAPSDVQNVAARTLDGAACITWENPPERDFEKTRIYKEAGGDLYLCGEFYEDKTDAFFTAVKNEADTVYVLKSVDKNGNESAGASVTVHPKASPYTISVSAVQGGMPVTALTPGKASISVKIKNNQMGDGFHVQAAAALVKGGRMVQLAAQETTVKQSMHYENPDEVILELTIPQEGDYHVEVFTWDGFDTMKILKNSVSFPVTPAGSGGNT